MVERNIYYASILMLLLASYSFGQERNTLKVRVLDQNSELIGSAEGVLMAKELATSKTSAKNGLLIFSKLKKGQYELKINAHGFETFVQTVEIKAGKNLLEVVLAVQEIREEVSVELTKREKLFEDAITKVFTRKEIDELPNNPQDIERELKRRFGNDAIIEVDWGDGGRIPDKSKIASIKVVKHVFDAEFHDVGQTLVRIRSRAGGNEWQGSLSLSFANAALNARDAFAIEKLPMQDKNVYFSLSPPAIKNKTSFHFSLSRGDHREKRNFIGRTPFSVLDRDRTQRNSDLSPFIKITHNLSEYHTLYTTYSFSATSGSGLGLGALDLSARSYASDSKSHTLRIVEAGYFGKYANNFKLEYSTNSSRINPLSNAPAVFVLDAFNKGGAGINNSDKSHYLQFTDILSFEQKGHSLKIGGEVEFEKSSFSSASNTNGSFTFSSLKDFERNTPALFTQRRGTSEISASQIKTALFFQDYLRISKYFQAGIGLRYEHQSTIKDYNNFAPRLGFVWSPEKTGRLILRGGLGIIYLWLETSELATILSYGGGESSNQLIIRHPGFPNPFAKGTLMRSAVELPSIMRKDDNLQNPEILSSFLSASWKPTDDLQLSLTYLFARGTHQFRSRDINALLNGKRPNPTFGRVSLLEASGNGISNRITAEIQSNLSKSLSIVGSYGFIKSRSDVDDIFELPSDNYNLKTDWGNSNGIKNHEINASSVFNLSQVFKSDFLKSIVLYANFKAASGLPYTITTGRDDNGDTVINDRPFGIKRNSVREKWTKRTDVSFQWNMSNLFSTFNKNGFAEEMSFTVTINNLFNQTNPRGYVGVQTSPFFRQPTYSDPARNINFGLYISF